MHIKTPFEVIIFGGLGDLSLRKLLPALYLLCMDGRLSEGCIFLISRRELKEEDLIKLVESSLKKHIAQQYLQQSLLNEFISRLNSIQLDLNNINEFHKLNDAINQSVENRVFYFATGSEFYMPICQGLESQKLIDQHAKLVLEKPIGHDLRTAKNIDEAVAEYVPEHQIYRIDHYLGKETVQNLMVLRFANSIFESQWNQHYIDHIQITISESLGVEKRAGFYDHVGAMRDMFQNHLLQLLCITAMEPPHKLESDAVRDEKVKVLKALKPIVGSAINDHVVRGQYDSGVCDGEPVPRYRDEPGIGSKSMTETFVAAKVEIENWRWAGVPFYLRTGKRLAERACEIVVQFKELPHSIFPLQHKNTMANKLIFRLQPDEGIRLMLCEKRVGPGMNVRPMNLSLNPANHKQTRVPEAYERLLSDVLAGNQTLFLRNDELIEAWRWIDPILKQWDESEQRPEPYKSGTWGPAAATLLLAKDGRLWDENS